MTTIRQQYWVIVPAAGLGRRFGGQIPKQYRLIHDLTVLEHAVKPFLDDLIFEKIVIALSEEDQWFKSLNLAHHPKIIITSGGATRADSVLNALQALPHSATAQDWILVHDAVRPCLLADDLHKLINEVGDDGVGGILAVPLADSLKQVFQQRIVQDIDRSTVWRALTPQMFRLSLLKEALISAKHKSITDEASAISMMGKNPKIVLGHFNNIKITWESDLTIAKAFL